MKLSSHIHFSEVDKNVIGLYSAYKHGIAFLPREKVAMLREGRFAELEDNVIAYLREKAIIVDDDMPDEFISRIISGRASIFNSLYLVTTTSCNLRCKYCVVLGEDAKNSAPVHEARMSVQSAKVSIERFRKAIISNNVSPCRITFYGGEPMLNVSMLHQIIPYIRSLEFGGVVEIVIITNGLSFDRTLLDVLIEHNVGVCVSIDGTKSHHDEARKSIAGRDTHDSVIRNYLRYRDAGLSVGISCTLGKHNIDSIEVIRYYFMNTLNAKFIEFQLPFLPSDGEGALYLENDNRYEELFRTYAVLLESGVIEGTIHRRVSALLSEQVRFSDCGAVGSQMVALPDGRIGPCHSYAVSGKHFSAPSNEDIDPQGIFAEWGRRSPFQMNGCTECPYIAICGGGCPYNAEISTGTIWNKDPQICDFNYRFIRWYLDWMWKKMNLQ